MEVFNSIIEKDRKKLSLSNSDIFSIFDSAPPDGPSKLWDESSVQYTFDSVVTLEESIASAAVNNYAICALYLRRIKVAIDKLENLIKFDPLCYLTDPVVFNLCTLYDLSCSPDISIMKKVVLQKLSTKYHVDDPMLHWRSFRLN